MSKITPTIDNVYENVVTRISRWWTRLSGRNEERQENEKNNESSQEYFPLKSILKKNKREDKTTKLRQLVDVVPLNIEIGALNTSRRKRETAPNRKGPIPTEELPSSQRGETRQTHASLNPSNLISSTSTADDIQCSAIPSNRGLLTYFARIAKPSNEDEVVDILFVQSLLFAGADINIGDKYGQRILHAVARDWHIDVAKFAVASGSDIDGCDDFGRTPLHVAAAANYPQMIEFLVTNGANLGARSKGENQTPIHYAAKNNALASLKCLIKLGADIGDRDYKERTPLFLAAEQGREDVVSFLLEFGSAAAVYDYDGNCAACLLVEKMPKLAYKALDQFLIEEQSSRKNYYYLSNLEFDVSCKLGQTPAKPILETLVYNEEITLVKHQVIQKLIEVKWRKFARFTAITDIILNTIYACVFTALAVFKPRQGFYFPLKTWGWRFALDGVFLLMTFYFVYKQAAAARRAKQRHENWQKWRIRCMSRDFKYCHPQWPEERRYLTEEIKRIRDLPVTYFRNGWNIYEWVSFIGIIAIIITNGLYHVKKTRNYELGVWIAYVIELLLVWLRLLKPFRTVASLSALIVMLGDIIKGSLQFLFVFLEFYIPLVTAYYVMFGGSTNDKIMQQKGIDKYDRESYTSLSLLSFNLYYIQFGGPFETSPLEAVDRKLAHIMISLCQAIMNIFCVNLFIALMSHLFQRVYQNARGNALLQRANYIIDAENNLSVKRGKEIRKHLRRNCGPLEVYEMTAVSDGQKENMNEVIENVQNKMTVVKGTIQQNKTAKDIHQYDHRIKRGREIDENLKSLITSQIDIEKQFQGKWEKIQKNQKMIEDLLQRPEIEVYLRKKMQAMMKINKSKP